MKGTEYDQENRVIKQSVIEEDTVIQEGTILQLEDGTVLEEGSKQSYIYTHSTNKYELSTWRFMA